MKTELEKFNEKQERMIQTYVILLNKGETGQGLREQTLKVIKRKRWKNSEKAMALADAEKMIAEAVKRHYSPQEGK